jgi:hypothetical protein
VAKALPANLFGCSIFSGSPIGRGAVNGDPPVSSTSPSRPRGTVGMVRAAEAVPPFLGEDEMGIRARTSVGMPTQRPAGSLAGLPPISNPCRFTTGAAADGWPEASAGASRCHAKDPLKVNAARRLVASRFVKQRAQISGFLGRVGFDHVYHGGIHVLVLTIVLQYALRPPVTLAVRQLDRSKSDRASRGPPTHGLSNSTMLRYFKSHASERKP